MQNLFQMQIGGSPKPPDTDGASWAGSDQRVKRFDATPFLLNVWTRSLVKGFMDGKGVDLMFRNG